MERRSALGKVRRWLTGSQRVKNKSGLSRRWRAAVAPSLSASLSRLSRCFSLIGCEELVLIGSPVAMHALCFSRGGGVHVCAGRSCKLEVLCSKGKKKKKTIWSDNRAPPGVKVERVVGVWRDALIPAEELRLTSQLPRRQPQHVQCPAETTLRVILCTNTILRSRRWAPQWFSKN